ncbi:MAG: ABC transporter permease subunit [Mollicutes bacterium]|nr:ABC transporter permease subunit [Mollicutes bacterium]
MIKKELKNNYKSLLIWSAVMTFLYLLVFIIYPVIIDKLEPGLLEEYLKVLPEEMLKIMNFDIVDIMSAFGWFKSEGYIMLILVGGIYSGIVGGNIMLKEENDGTINYLLSKPISRNKILFSKILSGLILITSFVGIITLVNFIGFEMIGDYNRTIFFLLILGSLIVMYVIFFISLLISSFFRKNKMTTSLTIGFVFLSYILQLMGGLSDKFSWLANLSVFELANGRMIIKDQKLSIITIIISLCIIILSLIYTVIRYKDKEFY